MNKDAWEAKEAGKISYSELMQRFLERDKDFQSTVQAIKSAIREWNSVQNDIYKYIALAVKNKKVPVYFIKDEKKEIAIISSCNLNDNEPRVLDVPYYMDRYANNSKDAFSKGLNSLIQKWGEIFSEIDLKIKKFEHKFPVYAMFLSGNFSCSVKSAIAIPAPSEFFDINIVKNRTIIFPQSVPPAFFKLSSSNKGLANKEERLNLIKPFIKKNTITLTINIDHNLKDIEDEVTGIIAIAQESINKRKQQAHKGIHARKILLLKIIDPIFRKFFITNNLSFSESARKTKDYLAKEYSLVIELKNLKQRHLDYYKKTYAAKTDTDLRCKMIEQNLLPQIE